MADRYERNPDGSVTLITDTGGRHTYDPDDIRFIESDVVLKDLSGGGQDQPIKSYRVAPESQQAMDDQINDALAKAGLPSLDELR